MSKLSILVATFTLAILISGCASQPAKGPDYYLLSSGDLSSNAIEIKPFKLALGPVEVPVYLDREGIATHQGQNQLSYSDSHRWAESLKENLIKALHANLVQLLPNQELIDFPYRQSNQPDYQLTVSIEKFGFVTDGHVELKARTTLVNSRGNQIDSSYINLKRDNIDQDYPTIVSTMSKLLQQMAVDLATRLAEQV